MNEVACRNDFAVIGADFRANVQRPGAGLRDHGTDTVTLSMTLDCRNARWRLPRYKSAAFLASPRESEGGTIRSANGFLIIRLRLCRTTCTLRKGLRGNKRTRSTRDTERKREREREIDGPIDTMVIRLKIHACN